MDPIYATIVEKFKSLENATTTAKRIEMLIHLRNMINTAVQVEKYKEREEKATGR